MKILCGLVLAVALVGCDLSSSDDYRPYEWVIDRRDVPSDELQRRLNILGQYGFRWNEDDDLEASGHYLYFSQNIRPSVAAILLPKMRAELEVRKQ